MNCVYTDDVFQSVTYEDRNRKTASIYNTKGADVTSWELLLYKKRYPLKCERLPETDGLVRQSLSVSPIVNSHVKSSVKLSRLLLSFLWRLSQNTKMAVFWVVAPCSLVEVYQHFKGP
jgi:hypothetical protein